MTNDDGDFSLFGSGEYVKEKTTGNIFRVIYGPELAEAAGIPVYIFEHASYVHVLDKNTFEQQFEATGKTWTQIP